MHVVSVQDFAEWRAKARPLLAGDVPPAQVVWNASDGQSGLFDDTPPPAGVRVVSINKDFLPLAENVALHRDGGKWALLYHAAYRLSHGEPHLLKLATDPLVHALAMMEKAVKRDAHKAKAFIRFRSIGDDTFVAWHEPDHLVLRKIGPFFARRFSDMNWSVFTPDESMHWDGETLSFGAGGDKNLVPQDDAQEALWKEYYRATFNPARIKIKMMKSEMPVRYWKNLPEAEIIADMLDEAPERVQAMLRYSQEIPDSAEPFVPESRCLEDLRHAAAGCEGCPLYKPATQTVFGEGAPDARLMVVGEQPGDEEDKQGHAFVGPAGQVLDAALKEVGLERRKLYITNAVKHFKFLRNQAGMRLHRTPTQKDINACLPWLDAEIEALKPTIILGLGVTAGKALFGPSFTLHGQGGRWHPKGEAQGRVTWHPSAVLRAPDAAEKEAIYREIVENLRIAASAAKKDGE